MVVEMFSEYFEDTFLQQTELVLVGGPWLFKDNVVDRKSPFSKNDWRLSDVIALYVKIGHHQIHRTLLMAAMQHEK